MKFETYQRQINLYAIFYKDYCMAIERGDLEAAERNLELISVGAARLGIKPLIEEKKKAAA